MDPLFFLANLLLSVTVGTLMVALVAYLAYKLREGRAPETSRQIVPADDREPVFLQRYVPSRDQATKPFAVSQQ